MSGARGRTVYSTGPGGPLSLCPGCGREPCACSTAAAIAAAEHALRVRRERGGRRGKTVTVAGPLRLRRTDAGELLRELKRRCGTGGTLKRGVDDAGGVIQQLELQGDHVEQVLVFLTERGFPSKRAGG